MTQTLKLTTRGKYAVMAMVEIGKAEKTKPVPLSDISESANISLSYLEQLIAGLRRHGLVRSYRGPGGGYCLNKPANDIIIADILEAAEDSTPAKRNGDDSKKTNCSHTARLWDYIGHILYSNLRSVSLSDVIRGQLKF